ncbi:MAG: ATP-binding protein [Cyclobacteriaceae bacterium]
MFRRFIITAEGTGLELYIVKRILDNTGGKVEIESVENNYTTIRIIF